MNGAIGAIFPPTDSSPAVRPLIIGNLPSLTDYQIVRAVIIGSVLMSLTQFAFQLQLLDMLRLSVHKYIGARASSENNDKVHAFELV